MMTPADAARVLAKAAAYDARTIGDADVMAWSEALADVNPADALAAVTRHYQANDTRLMPVHVLRIADEIRRERIRRADSARATAAIEAQRAEHPPVGVRNRSADVERLIAQVRVGLPDTGREAIRPREVEWERQRRLHDRPAPEPNPLYDPAAVDRLAAIDRELDR